MNIAQPIGFIGAGKVGCSIGKYLQQHGFSIAGYYSRTQQSATEAAEFTNSVCYLALDKLIEASDTLFIATGDEEIRPLWDHIVSLASLKPSLLDSKIICHFSGSLSSDVFSPLEYKFYSASIHPMLAFPNKFHCWETLSNAFFTLEGEKTALAYFSQMFQKTGNSFSIIPAEKKPLYHASASIISNHITALLDIGFSLFMDCGFSKEDMYQLCAPLIRGNIENVLLGDTLSALTGPIERNDISTVKKHLESLDEENKQIYRMLGKRLLKLAKLKHPLSDFSAIAELLSNPSVNSL